MEELQAGKDRCRQGGGQTMSRRPLPISSSANLCIVTRLRERRERFNDCLQQPDYFLFPPYRTACFRMHASRIRVDKQPNSFPTESHCSTSLYILPRYASFLASIGRRLGFLKLRFLPSRALSVFGISEAACVLRLCLLYGLQDRKKRTHRGRRNINVKMGKKKNMEDFFSLDSFEQYTAYME